MSELNVDPFRLDNKIILVAGASSGIGRATALLCAELGATLWLTGRDPERLEETRSALSGGGHHALAGDLKAPEFRQSLVEQLVPLDGLVFSAGVAELAPMRMVSEKHIESVFSINYTAPILLTQRLLLKKKLNADASLVYVTARAEHIAPIATGVYSAAKAALTASVRTLALEHAKQGIRANCISPGYVETPMLEKLQSISSIKSNVDLAPLGLLCADDVAQSIGYLLLPASRWITRTTVVVDAGLSLHVR